MHHTQLVRWGKYKISDPSRAARHTTNNADVPVVSEGRGYFGVGFVIRYVERTGHISANSKETLSGAVIQAVRRS